MMDIRKYARQVRQGFRRAVYGDNFLLDLIKAADIIKSGHMVNMSVREKHRVEARHTERQYLLAKIRRGINNDMQSTCLNMKAGAAPFIVRVGGNAHIAMTPYGGNADRSAGAEKGNFHFKPGMDPNIQA